MAADAKTWVVKLVEYHPGSTGVINDNVDVFVDFDDGRRYVATFFTMENIRALFEKNRETGECDSGRYFWASNMIIVRSLDYQTIAATVDDLIRNSEFEKIFDGPHPIERWEE